MFPVYCYVELTSPPAVRVVQSAFAAKYGHRIVYLVSVFVVSFHHHSCDVDRGPLMSTVVDVRVLHLECGKPQSGLYSCSTRVPRFWHVSNAKVRFLWVNGYFTATQGRTVP